jgi:ubiquinone/menaquinone biosynthesis C-methylase UbiE
MDDEAERVRSVYEGYGSSARRGRAWSAENPGNRLIRDEIVTAVRDAAPELARPPGDILDIGCGSGWWLRELAGSGIDPWRLYGLDLLEARVQAAGRSLPGAHVRQGDARALPWPDARFWLVTLFLVLSSEDSAESQTRSLKEARRVLAPGGHLFVWEPRLPNPRNRATRSVRRRMIRGALGRNAHARPVTVFPPLSRLAIRSRGTYEAFRRCRILCTHRLVHVHG